MSQDGVRVEKAPFETTHEPNKVLALLRTSMGRNLGLRGRVRLRDAERSVVDALDGRAARKPVQLLQVRSRDVFALDDEVHASLRRNWRTSLDRNFRSSCFISILIRSGAGRR